MNAGISTACLYPELLENAFLELARRKIHNIEIFINTHCELESSFITQYKCIKDEYSVNISSIHPYTSAIEPMMFFTPYERRVTDIIDYYKRYFELANILGANFLVFHGNKPQNPCPNKRYFERYHTLYEVGKSFGVTVVQENVARCTSAKLSFLKEMSDYLKDDVAFLLDIKQAVRSNEDPFAFITQLSGKIKHIHYSEHGPAGDCLPFGKGTFNGIEFLQKLKTVGFNENIILELYRGSYKTYDDLSHNYRKLEKAVSELS